MSIQTRVEPIDRDVQVLLTDDLSPAAQARMLAQFAREALSEAQAINRQALGLVPEHDTFVDGRADAPLDSVRPDGRIVFEFELLEDLFVWIAEQLVRHSPFRTGRYSASHAFFADGVEIEPSTAVPDAREWVFVNTQPYARKIERGLSPQAPDGVYQAVATLAARRFGNVARIRFTYRTVVGSTKDTNTRQPAISITLGR